MSHASDTKQTKLTFPVNISIYRYSGLCVIFKGALWRVWRGTIGDQMTHKHYRPGIDPDRRKGKSAVAAVLTWLSAFCWLLLFFAVILLDRAQPKLLTAETEWNEQILGVLYYLLLVIFSVSMIGLMINRKLHRRKTDMYRVSLVLNFVIALAGVMILVFR
jgi:hypothetical protein